VVPVHDGVYAEHAGEEHFDGLQEVPGERGRGGGGEETGVVYFLVHPSHHEIDVFRAGAGLRGPALVRRPSIFESRRKAFSSGDGRKPNIMNNSPY